MFENFKNLINKEEVEEISGLDSQEKMQEDISRLATRLSDKENAFTFFGVDKRVCTESDCDLKAENMERNGMRVVVSGSPEAGHIYAVPGDSKNPKQDGFLIENIKIGGDEMEDDLRELLYTIKNWNEMYKN